MVIPMENELLEEDKIIVEAKETYNQIRKTTIKHFVRGCIELGKILSDVRPHLKEKHSLYEFYESIELNPVQATQQIRLYEYSLINPDIDRLSEVLTNWAKLNMFLSLPEEKKSELLDNKEVDSSVGVDEFKQTRDELLGGAGSENIGETPEVNMQKVLSNISFGSDFDVIARLMRTHLGLHSKHDNLLKGVLRISSAGLVIDDIHNINNTDLAQQVALLYKQELENIQAKLDDIINNF